MTKDSITELPAANSALNSKCSAFWLQSPRQVLYASPERRVPGMSWVLFGKMLVREPWAGMISQPRPPMLSWRHCQSLSARLLSRSSH